MMGRGTGGKLDEQARALVERLHGRWTGEGGLCLCPAHDDRSPSLSVRVGRTSLLLHCFSGCAAADILSALRRSGAPVGSSKAPEPTAARQPGAAAQRSREAAIRLWGSAIPVAGTAAADYLAGRGVPTASPELRFHPRAPHGPRPATRLRPALLAAVRDGSGLLAVHRTFLDGRDRGAGGNGTPRYALGRLGGGCVRLGGVAARLGLAEGVETSLAASKLFGLPCWATLGTERFRLVTLPPAVRELVLFLDNDAGGRRAEALAREAFPHLPIETRYPRDGGDDWNDVLLGLLRPRGR